MINGSECGAEAGCVTQIGSLPHPNVDSAIAYAFRQHAPFLPQLPRRSPREFMVPQALDGLPGLKVSADGQASLDLTAWSAGYPDLQARLDRAFAAAPEASDAFAEFEPSPESWLAWRPFLWELSERRPPVAKIQVTGPLTAQWSLVPETGSQDLPGASPNAFPAGFPLVALQTQIFRLTLARAIAMARATRAASPHTRIVFFMDEPALYGLSRREPRHLVGMQELRILLETISKEGAIPGLHCCSNTDWDWVLALPIEILSFDAALSLERLLAEHALALRAAIASGKRIALGLFPQDPPATIEGSLRALQALFDRFGWSPTETRSLLRSAWITPACGLAFRTPQEAETLKARLEEFHQAVGML